MKKRVAGCGNEFLKNIVDAFLIAISGKPIKRFFLRIPITRLAKTVDRFHTWNGGTVPYANIRHAMFARHFLFLKRMLFIT